MEGKIIPSIILAAGFIGGVALFGNQVEDGVNALLNKDRIVTVKGLCEKEVKANHVIWPLSFNEMGNDLATVYDNLEKKQSTVFEFLKKGGIEPSEISLAAPKVNDIWEKAIEAQRELLKQGVALTNDYSYMTNYSFTGLNEIKPKMIEIATKNAKEAAKKFAEDSGSKLGKIRRANQGVFSITDRDDNTPFIKNVRVVTTVEYFLND